jgi:hypothetical protein
MTRQEVEAKAIDLVGSVYGEPRARDVVAAVLRLETLGSVRALRPLLTEA